MNQVQCMSLQLFLAGGEGYRKVRASSSPSRLTTSTAHPGNRIMMSLSQVALFSPAKSATSSAETPSRSVINTEL